MSFKESKTRVNLMKAFAGESQARNRYTIWAKKAKEEGFENVAAVFLETADHERMHAKLFYTTLIDKLGGDDMIEITATFPAHVGDTLSNLKAAAGGEHEEHTILYPEFAKVAEEEGYKDVAALFKNVAVAEKYHDERYTSLAKEVEGHSLYKKSTSTVWKCSECGYIFVGLEAPKVCPACRHPQGHYSVFTEKF